MDITITIIPLQVPEHYERLAELLNTFLSEPTSVERLMDEDRKMYRQGKTSYDADGKLIGYDRIRLAALLPDGLMIGYCTGWRAPWTEAGTVHSTIVVDPGFRGNGVGTQLADAVEHWARELKASELAVAVADHDKASLRFAELRGYATIRHVFRSSLNPHEFAESSLGEIERRLAEEGIRFLTLQEEPGEESEIKLYELFKQAAADIPGNLEGYPILSEWKKWFLQTDGYRPEFVLIAAKDDRYVGVVHLLQNSQTGGMYHEFTGVDREFRGKHIALALKIQAIRLAQSCGAPYMSTHNDSANGPMLSINRNRLGYTASPGHFRMAKRLHP